MYPTIFKGNVEVRSGINPALYGPGKLLVENDAIIAGYRTQINSTNFTIADNLPIVNYPPLIVGRDLGLLGSRNITDIINGSPSAIGTATTGGLNTIELDPSSSEVNDFYNGYIINITAGTGAGQNRIITTYDGTTKQATVDINWTTVPDGSSVYSLFDSRNVAFSWIENGDYFVLGTTPDADTVDNLRINPGNLLVNNLIVQGSVTGLDEVVCLVENSSVPEPIIKTDQRGSYLIVVESQALDGASATFSASKAIAATVGSTFRITSSTGAAGESIDIDWTASDKVRLYHSSLGPDPNVLCYNVRVTSVDIFGGENNIGANVGNLGVGPYEGKSGIILDFRNTAPGSNKISVSLDIPGKNILVDVNENNLTLDNLGGILSVAKGGTSLSSLLAGRFLVGNGIGPVDLSKIVPVGDVVGTTDSQALTNKTITDVTNNVVANSLRTTIGIVDVSASPAPITGYTLVATSPTTAVWQSGGGGMSEFEYITSPQPVTTTFVLNAAGVGGTTKLNWTTAIKPVGTYRIGWCYNYSIQSTTRDFIALIIIDGVIQSSTRFGVVSNAGGSNSDPYSIIGSGNNQNLMTSGFKYLNFLAPGNHSLTVKFGVSSNGSGYEPVTMSDFVFEIWRA
jgi:hypothetical protein